MMAITYYVIPTTGYRQYVNRLLQTLSEDGKFNILLIIVVG